MVSEATIGNLLVFLSLASNTVRHPSLLMIKSGRTNPSRTEAKISGTQRRAGSQPEARQVGGGTAPGPQGTARLSLNDEERAHSAILPGGRALSKGEALPAPGPAPTADLPAAPTQISTPS
jgi:hypothetical protein